MLMSSDRWTKHKLNASQCDSVRLWPLIKQSETCACLSVCVWTTQIANTQIDRIECSRFSVAAKKRVFRIDSSLSRYHLSGHKSWGYCFCEMNFWFLFRKSKSLQRLRLHRLLSTLTCHIKKVPYADNDDDDYCQLLSISSFTHTHTHDTTAIKRWKMKIMDLFVVFFFYLFVDSSAHATTWSI